MPIILSNFILIFFLLTGSLKAQNYSELIIDKNGKIIHQHNMKAIIHPASLTKLMTIYLTFHALKKGYLTLDDQLTISKKASVQPASKIGLKAGEVITVKEALNALIVKSANDASMVLAESLAPSEWNFTELMNIRAKKLGMHHSYFRNSSGLHYDDQITTAYDIGRLAFYLKKHFPEYYHMFADTSFKYKNKIFTSHNRVLLNYKYAEGMKTGYTKKSGFNLITSAASENQEFIAVIAGANNAKTRDKRMIEMLDQAFQNKKITNYY